MVNLYNKALDITELRKNAQIYNAKFKEDTSVTGRRAIMILGGGLDKNEYQKKCIEDIRIFVNHIIKIQSSLNKNDFIGIIYASSKQGHVEPLILTKNILVVVAPHNPHSLFKKVISDICNMNQVVFLSTDVTLQNRQTRYIQSDRISCGAIALKTIKTLLSPVEDGRLLINTLNIEQGFIPIQGSRQYTTTNIMDLPTDILKISQSEALVQEKIKDIPENKRVLLTGKHAGMPLEEHRSRFTKYSDEGKSQSSYVDRLREKYVERANDSGKVAFLNI